MGRFRGEFEVREGEYVVEGCLHSALFILTSDFAVDAATDSSTTA